MVTGTPRMVTDGLVFYVDAANTKSYSGSGTTWTDLSRTQTSASLFNGPTFDNSNGGSISFDGTNDYGSIPSISNQLTNECTAQVWVKIPSTYTASFGTIFTNRLNGDQFTTFLFGIDDRAVVRSWNPSGVSNNRAAVCVVGGGGSSIMAVWRTGSFTNNEWVNLTLSIGSSINFYYNGVLTMTTGSVGTFQNPNINVRLGNQYDTGSNDYPIRGNIAIASVYNRALSASEVLQNFEATRERFGL